MTIHPNARHRPSKSTIADPQNLLTFLLTSEPRLRRRDAEREVVKRFSWWNPWKPEWRPPEFSSFKKDRDRQGENGQRASYEARREEVFRQRREREKRQREEDARTSRQRRTESTQSNREEGDLFETGDEALNDWASKVAASSYDDLLI